MIFPVWNTMGRPQETNLHGIFHHLLRRLAATYSLWHLRPFPDTGIASLIHCCGSHLQSIGVQAYIECHHYCYVKDDRLWEQNNPPSNVFLLQCYYVLKEYNYVMLYDIYWPAVGKWRVWKSLDDVTVSISLWQDCVSRQVWMRELMSIFLGNVIFTSCRLSLNVQGWKLVPCCLCK